MSAYIKSTRLNQRIKKTLPVSGHYHSSQEHEWIEKTQVTEFSRSGAGLDLNHPVEIGRLIHLSFPLPRHLRAFDLQQEQYNIWAVIRNVRLIEPDISDTLKINVGTAFVGHKPPASFLQ